MSPDFINKALREWSTATPYPSRIYKLTDLRPENKMKYKCQAHQHHSISISLSCSQMEQLLQNTASLQWRKELMDFQVKSLGQERISPRKYFNPEAFHHRKWSSHTDYACGKEHSCQQCFCLTAGASTHAQPWQPAQAQQVWCFPKAPDLPQVHRSAVHTI